MAPSGAEPLTFSNVNDRDGVVLCRGCVYVRCPSPMLAEEVERRDDGWKLVRGYPDVVALHVQYDDSHNRQRSHIIYRSANNQTHYFAIYRITLSFPSICGYLLGAI